MAARRVHKPIWGFGWLGWSGIALLLAIITAVGVGFDIQHALIRAIHGTLGFDATVTYVARVQTFTWFGILGCTANVIVLASIAIGWRLASRPIPWWAWAAVSIVCVSSAMLALELSSSPMLLPLRTQMQLSSYEANLLVHLSMLGLLAIFVLALQRTRTGAALWLAAILVAGTDTILAINDVVPPAWHLSRRPPSGLVYIEIGLLPVAMQLLILAAMLHIGISSRRAPVEGCCQSCGYDRVGLAQDAPCPECAAAPEA
ncbi:MAG: hypothetical protein AAFR76_00040 [Planctomycetota bacterium]